MKRSIAMIVLMNVCVVFAVRNKTNSGYDQSDRQLLAQQRNSYSKIYDYCNTAKIVSMKQPKKYNHIPRGCKPNNKVRYQ